VSGGALIAKVDAFLKSVPNLKLEKPFKSAQLREIVQQGLASSADPIKHASGPSATLS
jgi:hypothetical protein